MRRKATLARERRGYTAAMRTMHWFTTSLLIGSYGTALLMGSASSSAELAGLMRVHRTFGAAILILTTIRLAWRQRTRVPELPADLPTVQRQAARASVVSLYALLLLQPLLGLGATMLHGDRLVLLGGLMLPILLSRNPAVSHLVFEAHGVVALVLLAVVGMHVGAALYHHFVRRDEVLAGMLPWAARLPEPEAVRASTSGRPS